ncbi:MAG TPA: GNAT family N-acetyltransferase [Anaerohalosphaeraceae bacterium]|nr:GNAT family N-acetyltransferase [Anaerohalosphaeraceae bacterium]
MEQIDSLRSIWQSIQTYEPYPLINVDIDRYISVLDALGKDVSPLILLFKQNEQPRAMLIGRLEKIGINIRIGYKTILRPQLYGMTVIYGGILGQIDEQISMIMIQEIIKLQKKENIEVVSFNHLRDKSLFFQKISKFTNICCRNHFLSFESHWRMRIPASIDEFYALRSKKHRQHLRQYQNKLEKDYHEKVKIVLYSRIEDIERLIKDVLSISRATYQFALGAGFNNTEQKRILLSRAIKKGWCRCYIMYIEEEPVAFRIFLQYGRICYGDGIGHNPKWSKYRVGTILFLKVLDALCKSKEVDYYDFGFGDAEYKASYAEESWQEVANLYLFAPHIYPTMINILCNLNDGLAFILTKIIKKIQLSAWIKRLWRKKLQMSSKQIKETQDHNE